MREETFRAAVAAIVGFEGRDLLPTLDVPVLCIAGERDTTAPAAVMQKMAAKIAGAEFVSLTGLGHFGWAEDPQRVQQCRAGLPGPALLVFLSNPH
jgi:3-oxoadipate enol-lactonase